MDEQPNDAATIEETSPTPVERLRRMGEEGTRGDSPDCLALGIGPEHVPELIRIVTDTSLSGAPGESADVWGPLYAWRALGQLRAEAAIEPLIGLLEPLNEDDWANDELPNVFGMIGPAAIPPLTRYLTEPTNHLYPRTTTATALKEIAQRHPAHRAEALAGLVRQLEGREALNVVDEATVNGFVISDLIDLQAAEALPAIERTFADNRVDLSIVGDWDDVQAEFGLKPRRPLPEPVAWGAPGTGTGSDFAGFPSGGSGGKSAGKKKAKRKMAQDSRRKNRKRK